MPTRDDHHHHHLGSGDHGHPRRTPPDHAAGDGQAQVLELDAEIMAEHTAAIAAWLPVHAAPAEIVDLGAGTGAALFALLRQFPQAHLTAVDASADHLAQLQAKADAAGLTDRVDTVQADLDAAEWPDLGAPDLVWAAASMHHLADPDVALRRMGDLLAPDGLLAVVELAGLPRFLPATAPEDSPGLEERCHAALEQRQAEHLPHRGADWGPHLTTARFTVLDTLDVDVVVSGADSSAVGPYALAVLHHLRVAAADTLSDDDLASLDRLLDTSQPSSILRRGDLAARTTRTVWAARGTGGEDGATASRDATAADGPQEWFSAAAEAANCQHLLGHRRHGLDAVSTGGQAGPATV